MGTLLVVTAELGGCREDCNVFYSSYYIITSGEEKLTDYEELNIEEDVEKQLTAKGIKFQKLNPIFQIQK